MSGKLIFEVGEGYNRIRGKSAHNLKIDRIIAH